MPLSDVIQQHCYWKTFMGKYVLSCSARPLRPPFPVVPLPICKPFMPVECSAADLGSCQASLTEISLMFDLQCVSCASDRWGAAVWESEPGICNSYRTFITEMKKVFDHLARATKSGWNSVWQSPRDHHIPPY
uniref:Uncharacterized protein n=1 Tax=Stegastes partitus TaxID=144197 RepID=A0A3B4ZPA9_9TELE